MDIYEIFDELNISYCEAEHPPVYTVSEAQAIKDVIEGTGSKNLFLTDGKQYFLLVLDENKRANLKELAMRLNSARLSFASEEELLKILGLQSGSVSPFGIINDTLKLVTVIIDQSLAHKKLLLHPNINTKTVSVMYDDLLRFIEYTAHAYIVV